MRLISFVGTGNYGETSYSFEGATARTRYVAHALASFLRPDEIHLIATVEAWGQHGATLTQTLIESGHPQPVRVQVGTTGEPQNLWDLFGKMVEAIQTSPGEVLLDITHGFRMQPFFAAACVEYVQSVLPSPPRIRVVYGEYRPAGEFSPVWELTAFLEVLSWSRNLMRFLQTGQADGVVQPTEELGRELSRTWATSDRQGDQPSLRNLAQTLRDFSDDFTTIRTGALLTGNRPSVQRVLEAIERSRNEVGQHLPALALVLDQIRAQIAPLRIDGARLSSQEGQRALLALARLYQSMGRYSEAISILREGWITRNAAATCDEPGGRFQREERAKQEAQWQGQTEQARSVSEIRNDIQHAGFNPQPHSREWFEDQLTKLLEQWEQAIESMEAR